MPVYKQLPNAKMYNKNGDQIDPFCKDKLNISSEDNTINVSKTDTGYDISLNTEPVELIDFTNFHNYYIRDEIDWTSQNGETLKHSIVDCNLSGETLTIVSKSQAGSDNDDRERVFYFERSVASSDKCYIPLCGIDATDCLSCFKVAIWFGTDVSTCYNTNIILLSDTPPQLSWCMAKNLPFTLVGKQSGNQLFAFIEVPSWFIGRIEISIERLKRRSGSNIFSYKVDPLAVSGYSYQTYNGYGEEELYAFDNLNSFTDIVPTLNDQYGVLDVDFFIDSIDVLEIQSDNSIPDWIINDLCVHELLLHNKLKGIIMENNTNAITFDSTPTEGSNNPVTSGGIKTALDAKQDALTLPLPIANGGTAATTARQAEYNLITRVRTELNSAVTDEQRIPYVSTTPSASNAVFMGYRKASALWTYIKSKADSVYVSTKASQGLSSTAKSNAKANIGLDNVDNTSDATKKTNFTGSIANGNTGFVTGGDIYNALHNRLKTISVTDDNYTDANLFNDVIPGDVIHLNLNGLTHDAVDIAKCNYCFIILTNALDLFKLKYSTNTIYTIGALSGSVGYIVVYIVYNYFHILSKSSDDNRLRFANNRLKSCVGGNSTLTGSLYTTQLFTSSNPITKLAINIYDEKDLLILNKSMYTRAIQSFGDIQHPSDITKCSTFNGFFPENIIKYTNSGSWEKLFVGCGFALENDYVVKPNGTLSSLNKTFYYAFSYNSQMTNIDLTTALSSNTDLTSCFESAEYFNVILDGVDLTDNTCTDMFKDARNITISAIGCNQDTIDKINANISGSHTSTITVITTDPNA